MTKLVDIMMLTYNRWEYTEKTIASVIANTTYPYRLCVTDNRSTDGTREHLQRLFAEGVIHKLFLEDSNLGNVGGKNTNLKRAETDFVCLLDNDMILKPGWLSKCMGAMKHFKKDRLVLMSPWPIWKFATNTAIGHLRDSKYKVVLTRKLSGQVWIGDRKVLLKAGGFKGSGDGRFMGFFASPLSKKLVKKKYRIGCIEGEELAISIDRAGSPLRIETEDMKLYRKWNRLQKNKHKVLPDFDVWKAKRV